MKGGRAARPNTSLKKKSEHSSEVIPRIEGSPFRIATILDIPDSHARRIGSERPSSTSRSRGPCAVTGSNARRHRNGSPRRVDTPAPASYVAKHNAALQQLRVKVRLPDPTLTTTPDHRP